MISEQFKPIKARLNFPLAKNSWGKNNVKGGEVIAGEEEKFVVQVKDVAERDTVE
jgi:hypothetical protein